MRPMRTKQSIGRGMVLPLLLLAVVAWTAAPQQAFADWKIKYEWNPPTAGWVNTTNSDPGGSGSEGEITLPDSTLSQLLHAQAFSGYQIKQYKIGSDAWVPIADGITYMTISIPESAASGGGTPSVNVKVHFETYVAPQGRLIVNLTQNGFSGTFSVTGPGGSLGTGLTSFDQNVDAGGYTVNFTDPTGYYTLAVTTSASSGSPFSTVDPSTGSIAAGETHTVNGVYNMTKGRLIVNTTLNGFAGSFSVNGPGVSQSGLTSFDQFVSPGAFTVNFVDPTGYYTLAVTTSASTGSPFSTVDPSTGSIAAGQTQTVNGVYSQTNGRLIVNLTNNGFAGSFSVTGPGGSLGTGLASFDQVVDPGAYSVNFVDPTGLYTLAVTTSASSGTAFSTIDPSTGTIGAGETHTVNGVYAQTRGRLIVNLTNNGFAGSFSVTGPGGSLGSGLTSFDQVVDTGGYTVDFVDPTGLYTLAVTTSASTGTAFSTVDPSTGTIAGGETHTVNGVYSQTKGRLIVNLTNNGFTGSFSVTGPGGSLGTGLASFDQVIDPGAYNVNFVDPTGFYTLAVTTSASSGTPFGLSDPSNGSIGAGETHTVNGVYTQTKGRLIVNLTNNGFTGSFSVTGPGGSLGSGLTSFDQIVDGGAYSVDFVDPSGYSLTVTTSADAGVVFSTSDPSAGSIAGGQTHTVNGVYDPLLGNLKVLIYPGEANADGAMWTCSYPGFGSDKFSGFTATGLQVGTYKVFFKDITGWNAPYPVKVTILANQTVTVYGIYSREPVTATGDLQVFIIDNQWNKVLDEGALWRPTGIAGLEGEDWHASGDTIHGLPTGNFGLQFKMVPGYILPDLGGGTIKPNVLNKYTGEYIRPLLIHKSDYNGDGADDLAVFEERTGKWFVASISKPGKASPTLTDLLEQKFGRKFDIAAPGDYDGDGFADLAYYREKRSEWKIFKQYTIRNFGQERDIPVPGDYNGDGMTDAALFRPTTGEWFIYDHERDKIITVKFGVPGDVPVPGNYDGDAAGMTDLGIYNVETSEWRVAIYNEDLNKWVEVKKLKRNSALKLGSKKLALKYGKVGDIPIQADYDGDGRVDHAVYERSTSIWFVKNQFEIELGNPGDIPVPNDWAGLGRVIPAVFQVKNGRWVAIDNLLKTKHGKGGQPLMSGR